MSKRMKPMITIRNINERYGWPTLHCGETLADAIADLQSGVRSCGPEFSEIEVTDDDYEIVDDGELPE